MSREQGSLLGEWVRRVEMSVGSAGLLLAVGGLAVSAGSPHALSPHGLSALITGVRSGSGSMILALGLFLLLLAPVLAVASAVVYGIVRRRPRTALLAAGAFTVIALGALLR